jgi:hypothetical protein
MVRLIEQRSELVAVSEMVPEGSIGSAFIAKIADLGGRPRAKETFCQPLDSLLRKNQAALLAERGFTTVADVLKLPSEDQTAINLVPKLYVRLRRYLTGLLVLPHSRLLQAIHHPQPQSPVLRQFPVPVGREQEIVEGVEGILTKFENIGHTRGARILRLRYGLDDGITRLVEKVGGILENPLSKEYVRLIEKQAIWWLWSRRVDLRAEDYLSLPEASFGREVFGAVLMKDLPDLGKEASLEDLHLPLPALCELEGKIFRGSSNNYCIGDLITYDLSEAGSNRLSDSRKNEIVAALRKRAEAADRSGLEKARE